MKKLTHKNLLDFLMALPWPGFRGKSSPDRRNGTVGPACHIIDPLFVDEAVGFGWWSRILHTF